MGYGDAVKKADKIFIENHRGYRTEEVWEELWNTDTMGGAKATGDKYKDAI